MISKDLFIKTINKLKLTFDTANKVEDALQEACKTLHANYINLYGVFTIDMGLTLGLLSVMFKDEENDWIGHYIYVSDFGRNPKYNVVSYTDGTPDLVLDSPEKLYQLLIENLNEDNG